jgi:ActR/RegA family two-component response regulator
MSSRPPRGALDVLIVSEDAETLRTIANAITGMGDRAVTVSDLAQAVALAGTLSPAVALVDVTLAGGGGLALVHHLPAVRPEIAVYVMAPGPKLHIALEGLTLGATGMLTLPPSGDAVMRAIAEVRTRLAASVQHDGLEAELSLQRRRGDHMHRLVRIAAKAGWTELARTVAEAIAELTHAHAVSAYRVVEGTLMRVVLVGTSDAPDEVRAEAALDPYGEIFSLGAGALLVEKGQEDRRGLAAELTGFAVALLALAGHAAPAETPDVTRFEPLARFALLAVREVEKARRYKRQVTFAAMKPIDNQAPPNAPKLEDLFQILIRDGDVLGRDDAEEEVLLMLPDTGALGGQLFRRRFGLRALGLATFPQDGSTSERLVRVARQRAEDARRSPVRMLGLAPKRLRDIIESLLDCPMFDAGLGSSYPLDLSLSAALSLVEHTCIEARRGGAVSIVVAAHGRPGFASAARAACVEEGEKVTLVEVDLTGVAQGDALEAVVVAAEHGTWICCGVRAKDRIKAVHAADAMLADLLAIRLLEIAEQNQAPAPGAP